ncbi:hypothetical protein [Candidatus Frankia alpina]|uniref:hypothetical protein n=1 Tax=Candidatus Frankia alpina TaxID=2699483 RepID=UPI001967FD68|nr:hypothetical protein [Candidatus Frankia alpina]
MSTLQTKSACSSSMSVPTWRRAPGAGELLPAELLLQVLHPGRLGLRRRVLDEVDAAQQGQRGALELHAVLQVAGEQLGGLERLGAVDLRLGHADLREVAGEPLVVEHLVLDVVGPRRAAHRVALGEVADGQGVDRALAA